MTKTGLQVLIVGGGIGGLAAAIAILRAGHSVTVVEAEEKIEEVRKTHL
jgi:salicylate hydroxylase